MDDNVLVNNSQLEVSEETDIKSDNLDPVSSTSQSKAKTEPSPKKRKLSEDIDDDEGNICPICLDYWTNAGAHRVCALKCGHLFGWSCVKRWFGVQRQKSCPTCKKKSLKREIRYIYTKKLIALDTVELEHVKKQLAQVTNEKIKIQEELSLSTFRENYLREKLQELTSKTSKVNSNVEFKRDPSFNTPASHLYMEKSLEICKGSGCRVLDFSDSGDVLAVSMKSPNNLFLGYGIRRVDVATYRPISYIALHSQPIRDISFHFQHQWLASVSLDKSIKIIETANSSSVICEYTANSPLWSCCWDLNNPNMIYAGKQSGSIDKFDIRNMSQPVYTYIVPNDTTGVVSVASVLTSTGIVNRGGIIGCKLNSVWIFEDEDETSKYPFCEHGPYISMDFDNHTSELLLSTRCSSNYPCSRHKFYTLKKKNHIVDFKLERSFDGSRTQKYLSRSRIVRHAEDTYVAAHQETSRIVYLWNIQNDQRACCIPAHEPVLDLCSFTINSGTFLTTLTARKLEFFKFLNH